MATQALPAGRTTRYLSLTRELALTNFKLKYTGSVLGYLWSLMKPALYFGVLYTIFVHVFRLNQRDFPLELLVGIVVFTFFAECTSNSLGAISGNAHLVRKALFPLSALVVSQSITALITLSINLSLIVAVAGPLGRLHLGLQSLLALPLLLELYLLALGLGMLLASLHVFFHDVAHIWEVMTQFMLYGAGVVFPASLIPLRWRGAFFLNPLAQIVEDMRRALVTPAAAWTGQLVGWEAAIPIILSVALFGAGLLCFRRLAPTFAESL